jgi:hypothetical protein
MSKDIKRATGDKLAAAFDRVDPVAVAREERAKQEQQKRKGK